MHKNMHEITSLDNLMVLPCRLNDVGSQRCWLGMSVMNKQSIMLYDVVKIECVDRRSFLCRVWPRLDKVGDGYIQFDGTVFAADFEQHYKVPDSVNDTLSVSVPVLNVQKVTCSAVKSVSVTVVVTDWREFVLCSKSSLQVLQCRIRNLLAGVVIAASHSMLCSRATLGKLYCWDRIIFHNVVIKNSCICGYITHSTEIGVVEVISKEKFEQHTEKAPVLGGLESEINLLCSIVLQCQKPGLPGSLHKQVIILYVVQQYCVVNASIDVLIYFSVVILILSFLNNIC